MFDDTMYDLGDLPSHEQAVDIACEIVAICDQLRDLRLGKGNRTLATTRQSSFRLITI